MYVDSGSDDDSASFAENHGASLVTLDLSRPFTAARARNEGLRHLLDQAPQLTYVQFIDGDCELEGEWIERARQFLDTNEQAAVACGRRRERFAEASAYNRWMDEEWDTPIGEAAACGGDALMRVAALKEVGGFNEAISAGEEPELCCRLRARDWTVNRLHVPMTIHDADMHHFTQWWKRAVRSGYGYAQVFQITLSSPARRPLYARELARAFAWTAGVAGASILLSLVFGSGALVLAPLAWGAQLIRLSLRNGLRKGIHLLLAKVAESWGALICFKDILLRRNLRPIFYK